VLLYDRRTHSDRDKKRALSGGLFQSIHSTSQSFANVAAVTV